MKIKVKEKSYEEVLAMRVEPHRQPLRPPMLFRVLLRQLSAADLKKTHFKCREINMERLGKREPCLILMNHSSFIDLKIAATVFFPVPLILSVLPTDLWGKAD